MVRVPASKEWGDLHFTTSLMRRASREPLGELDMCLLQLEEKGELISDSSPRNVGVTEWASSCFAMLPSAHSLRAGTSKDLFLPGKLKVNC